jgi:hypothetical protein
MSEKPKHVEWLVDNKERIRTIDGKTIQVWELCHQPDDQILSAWAKHFRQHYCLDQQIDALRKGTQHSRSEYLLKIKFPDEKNAPGPSIRSGDFGEILIADFLEYILGFWVPRTRYIDKTVRNESTKGCDIIGFWFAQNGVVSENDALCIFEAKAQLSGDHPTNRLQDAVDGSEKDRNRKAESLNAIKQRFLDLQNTVDADRIERFQNPEDNPYQELSGAAALFSADLFNSNMIQETSTKDHSNNKRLKLIVIRGANMMNLVHELYRRAAHEA